MTNHTCPIRLSTEFLCEAAPILDDALGYSGIDDYLNRLAPVAAKIEAAPSNRDWSVRIDVTADEADLLRDEAEYRRDYAPDRQVAAACQKVADRCKVIVAELAPFVAVALIEVEV